MHATKEGHADFHFTDDGLKLIVKGIAIGSVGFCFESDLALPNAGTGPSRPPNERPSLQDYRKSKLHENDIRQMRHWQQQARPCLGPRRRR